MNPTRPVGIRRLCVLFLAPAVLTFVLSAAAQTAPRADPLDLHRALDRADPQWRTLVETTRELNHADELGNTPLHLAALRGLPDAVEALLARGANPNATNANDAPPLHYGTGDERIVRALLAKGANPNARSKAGMTPLLSAVHRGRSFPVVRLLLEAGADLNARRGGDENAVLTQALFGGDPDTVRFLFARGAKPAPAGSRDGVGALEMATMVGDLASVQTLLARGADVNTPSNFFGHSLNAAFYSANPHIAALLIERGADLRVKSPWGHGTPPMVWSAYNERGDTGLARLLVTHGVDVNDTSESGETALSFALRRGADTPLVRYLRTVGAKEPVAPRAKPVPARLVPSEPPARAAMLRESTQRSLALLTRASRGFLENGFVRNEAKCVSCHHQMLPAVALGLARERGFEIDEHELGRMLHAQLAMWGPKSEGARQMRDPVPDPTVSIGYGLDALAAVQYAPDEITDAYIHYLIGAQLPEGSWTYFDYRPPMEGGRIVATAWGIRALALYRPTGENRAADEAVRRAREWLVAQEPQTLEEQTFQLLGLAWAGTPSAKIAPYVNALVAAQRDDGGWASLHTRDSDAWATGTALVALQRAGVATTHASYQRGIDYLLRTQFNDGSWWVRSRTWPFQPHFDSQFPHGKDQWISAGGTAWAAIAMLLTIEPRARPETLANGRSLIGKFGGARPPGPATPSPNPPVPVSNGPARATLATAHVAGERIPAVSFRRQIWPILDRSCASCHAGDKVKGGFSLGTRDALLKGGQSGDAAITPGRSAESRLLAYVADKVEDLEMPPLSRREKYPPLSSDEVALLRAWIDAGAEWDKAN